MDKDLDDKILVVLVFHRKGVIGVLEMVEVVANPMWVTAEGMTVENESEDVVLDGGGQ